MCTFKVFLVQMSLLGELLQAPQVTGNLRHAQLLHALDVRHLRAQHHVRGIVHCQTEEVSIPHSCSRSQLPSRGYAMRCFGTREDQLNHQRRADTGSRRGEEEGLCVRTYNEACWSCNGHANIVVPVPHNGPHVTLQGRIHIRKVGQCSRQRLHSKGHMRKCRL